jgi:hypothetical protein
MPTCEDCHGATIAVAHTASAVRDLGFAGAVSIAAASALGIACKRACFDGPVAPSAAGTADANQTHLAAYRPGEVIAFVPTVMPRAKNLTDSGLGNRAPDHL